MNEPTGIPRRQFLKAGAAGVLGAGLAGRGRAHQAASAASAPATGKIKEYRVLGRTGFKVSDVGFGGADLQEPELFQAAVDAGINYFDVAEHYGRGAAERAIGDVLKRGSVDRKSIFITTKLNISRGEQTKETIKDRALKCLERLGTGYVDCLQVHTAPTLEQVKRLDKACIDAMHAYDRGQISVDAALEVLHELAALVMLEVHHGREAQVPAGEPDQLAHGPLPALGEVEHPLHLGDARGIAPQERGARQARPRRRRLHPAPRGAHLRHAG